MRAVERVINKIEFLLDRQRYRTWEDRDVLRSECATRYGYHVADDPRASVARLLNVNASDSTAFEREWQSLDDELKTLGTGLDSDKGLAGILYDLVTNLRPQTVIETGVARGVSSRMMLSAMDNVGAGHLVSIDLYDEADARIAVPERLRHRWTFVAGSSRTHLEPILRDAAPDIFIHDSQHTYRNMRFELSRGWEALSRGGVLVADDIHENRAFAELIAATSCAHVIGQESQKAGLFGVALKT